jgi:hypothetical protein
MHHRRLKPNTPQQQQLLLLLRWQALLMTQLAVVGQA